MLDIDLFKDENYGLPASHSATGDWREVKAKNPELIALIDTAYTAALFFAAGCQFFPDGMASLEFEGDALGTIVVHRDGSEISEALVEDGEWRAPLSAAVEPICETVEYWAFKRGVTLRAIDGIRAVRSVVTFKAWEMDVAAGRLDVYSDAADAATSAAAAWKPDTTVTYGTE